MSKSIKPILLLAMHSAAISAFGQAASADAPMPRLALKDGHFVAADSGAPQRFWGMNLVSAFPTRAEADGIADNLAALGVNLVRLHHLLRPSKDWTWRSNTANAALVDYKTDSRTPDAEAWERFDYLNAALRKHGIRLVLSLHFSRKFMPADAAIDNADAADAQAWSDAVKEINSWHWQKSIDPVKALPVIDRRARLLQKEFAKNLLSHRNPHTGLTYGEDPQTLYIEIVNESSLEYALICGNQFPDYFEQNLQNAWLAYAAKHAPNLAPGNHRAATSGELGSLRSDFYRAIEDDYFRDMRDYIRNELRAPVPVAAGNLWRGNDALAAYAAHGDLIEEHHYVNPLVVETPATWVDAIAKTRVEGKPYFLGEFNYTENQELAKKHAYARPMLMLSAAAYGAFHDIDGVVWFAYNHGDRNLGSDGYGKPEHRLPALGDIATDAVMLDHMATASALFRTTALQPAAPIFRDIPLPRRALNYNELMADAAPPPAGAGTLHSYRKRFTESQQATPPPLPAYAPLATPRETYVSETQQITRDLTKRQLAITAPAAEAFSGFLTDGFPTTYKHLATTDATGFATIIAVALDDQPLAQSRRILLSRTWMNESSADLEGLSITLRALAPASDWRLRIIRPRVAATTLCDLTGADQIPLKQTAAGLILPKGTWTQIELLRGK